ncbi:MAG: hypothetical protein ACT4O3_09595 [Elusimicrobiota bacterium]
MSRVLSFVPGLGQVGMCGRCQDVHLVCGGVTLRLAKEAFFELARMIQAASGHPALGGADGLAGFSKEWTPGKHLSN